MNPIFQLYSEWNEQPRWGISACEACRTRECHFISGKHSVLSKRITELKEQLSYNIFIDLPSVQVCLDCYITHRISEGLDLKDRSEWIFHMPKLLQTYANAYEELLKVRDRNSRQFRLYFLRVVDLKRFMPRDIRQKLQECIKMDYELKHSPRLKTRNPYYWAGATGRETEFFESGFKELLSDDSFRQRKYTDYFAAKLGDTIRIPPFVYKLEEIRLQWHDRLYR